MNLIAQLNQVGSDAGALRIGYLAVAALSCYGLWAFIRWFLSGPIRPDPWEDRVAAEIANDETTPLCHRCLVPNEPLANFCSQCGAPVGEYTNWLPYPCLFSIGHTLRLGTSGEFKHSPLTITGFFLFSFAEYAVFAPIYWFSLLWGLFHQRQPSSSIEQQPTNSVE